MKTYFSKIDIGAKFYDTHENLFIKVGVIFTNTDTCKPMHVNTGKPFEQKRVDAVCIEANPKQEEQWIPGMGAQFENNQFIIVTK